MKTAITRLKLTLLLSLAFFLPAIWTLTLSSSTLFSIYGIPLLLGWAYVMSFGAAYAVVLFIGALRQESDSHGE